MITMSHHARGNNVKFFNSVENPYGKTWVRENPSYSEPAIRVVLWQKVFLEISQNSQETTCTRVSFCLCSSVIYLWYLPIGFCRRWWASLCFLRYSSFFISIRSWRIFIWFKGLSSLSFSINFQIWEYAWGMILPANWKKNRRKD